MDEFGNPEILEGLIENLEEARRDYDESTTEFSIKKSSNKLRASENAILEYFKVGAGIITDQEEKISESRAALDDRDRLIDRLQKEITRSHNIIAKISGIVSERHGDDGLYEDEYSDDDEKETGTIKLIFDTLDEFDEGYPQP